MTAYERIYDIVCAIPRGKVATYGQVARLCGQPRWSRVVGYALHRNPLPLIIPCHRVVDRFGRVADSFAFGGKDVQRERLEAEGVQFEADGHIDLSRFGWNA